MIQIMLSTLRISSMIHVNSNCIKEYKTHTHTHTRDCSTKGGGWGKKGNILKRPLVFCPRLMLINVKED